MDLRLPRPSLNPCGVMNRKNHGPSFAETDRDGVSQRLVPVFPDEEGEAGFIDAERPGAIGGLLFQAVDFPRA